MNEMTLHPKMHVKVQEIQQVIKKTQIVNLIFYFFYCEPPSIFGICLFNAYFCIKEGTRGVSKW